MYIRIIFWFVMSPHKQPSNYGSKRFARTAKTNLEPLLSECLLLHLARLHVHITERVLYIDCAEKGFCCVLSTSCGCRVWSTQKQRRGNKKGGKKKEKNGNIKKRQLRKQLYYIN